MASSGREWIGQMAQSAESNLFFLHYNKKRTECAQALTFTKLYLCFFLFSWSANTYHQYKIQTLQVTMSKASLSSLHTQTHIFFYLFFSHPYSLLPCAVSIFIRLKQGLCLPVCQAHQRDVGQQRVQALWGILLITLHNAVILGKAGQKERKRIGRWKGERERMGWWKRRPKTEKQGVFEFDSSESEKASEQMLNTDVYLSQNKAELGLGNIPHLLEKGKTSFLFAFAWQSQRMASK